MTLRLSTTFSHGDAVVPQLCWDGKMAVCENIEAGCGNVSWWPQGEASIGVWE